MKTLLVALLLTAVPAAWCQEPDAEECKESKIISRVPKCRIHECSVKDFDSAEVTTAFSAGDWQKKTLEGKVEILKFECAEGISRLQVVRNGEAAMKQAGFQVVFSGKSDNNDYPMVTGRKGATWVEIRTWDNNGAAYYDQTAVVVQEMKQEVTAGAEAWAGEIEKSGRVSVYGVNFDSAKAVIRAESEPVLQEILTLLTSHEDLKLRVEGHTDSTGAKAANQALSQQRAAAVVAWLTGKGVAANRLAAQGLGDSKPLAGNDTEEGKAKNRRVELVKM